MGSKSSKKIGKIILWILAGFVALDLLLVGLLFVPAIQTYVVNKITQSISEKWGAELSIKDVRLTPSLRLVAHEVRICDTHNNDMIYVGKVNARIRGISIKPFKLKFGNVTLEDAEVMLRKYLGDDTINISLWAKIFPRSEVKPTFLLTAKHLKLVNSRFTYINDYQREVFSTDNQPPMDYAFLELKDINWEVDNFIVLNDSVGAKFNHLAFNQYSGFSMTDGSGDFHICPHGMQFNGFKATTTRSNLDFDLNFKYDDWYDYGEFLDSVRIIAQVRPSTLNMCDVADFVGQLRGMSEVVTLSADRFDGTVNDFRLINLNANCGPVNQLHGDLALQNITTPAKAHYNVNIDSCSVYVPGLALLTLPGDKKLEINNTIAELGQTHGRLTFNGTLTDFNSDLTATSAVGDLNASITSLVYDEKLMLQGNVSTSGINIAKLIHNDKVIGGTAFNLAFEGGLGDKTWSKEGFQKLQGTINGDISRLDIYNYPLKNTSVSGVYKNRLYDLTLHSDDPHLKCDIIGQLDMTEEKPILQGNIAMNNIDLGTIANVMPQRDSSTAKGIDKIIYTLQQNPTMEAGFDNLTFTLRGSNIDNVSGYIGCDNIRVYNNGDSLSDCRFRITSINTDIAHKFIVSSNIANASLETNYPLACAIDSIKAFAHNYFPSLIPAPKSHQDKEKMSSPYNKDYYIIANASTYRTYNVLKLVFPDLFIASNSTLDMALYSDERNDMVEANIPFFFIRNKIRIHNLTLNGNTLDQERIKLDGSIDSLIIGKRNSKLKFDHIAIEGNSNIDSVLYDISWYNDFNKQTGHRSKVAGSVVITEPEDIIFHLRNTSLCLNDMDWVFNDGNAIHLKKNRVSVDNLVIHNDSSFLHVDGDYSFNKSTSDLNIKADALDLALANPLISTMSFGGRLTADVHLRNGQRRLLLGKVLADDFVFNDTEIGDLFMMAGWNGEGNIGFTGGFFHNNEVLTASTLSSYDVREFQKEDDIFAHVQGLYETNKKRFQAHATFDTLNAGFLDPFLSGFSDHIKGTASGKLSFYANPDSTYFDGNVKVIEANMGIAALGTNYDVKDQNIRFNAEGIFFDNMRLSDPDGNKGVLRGSIKHKMFKDMLFDLKITTPGIMVLNTPKTVNSSFYGKGYASGMVTITGTDEKLAFRGANLETLEGTKIYLQVNSANSASESDIIRFKTTVSSDSTSTEESKSGMELDFDFTFNVTDNADIVLSLESIGGTLNARANGNFRLTYNAQDNLNLYGSLALHSGYFRFSLYNIVNSRFTLVPGGSIIFDGPLDNMVVNASAYKSSKTSLASIVPQEYLVSTASSNVDAYLHLNGEIMKNIDPTFSFELPNSSPEVRNIFYNAIDTTNKENMTKQFAYFMVTNNFMPNDLFSNSGTGDNYSMLSNFINNTISKLMEGKKGSFGVIYNQASESTAAEYGITANANLLQNRINMSTSIGYYNDKSTAVSNNIYGDFTVEYNINKEGTWKLKAYTYIGEHDESYYNPDFNSQINYTAGVGLAYKQSFDSRARRRIKRALESSSKSTKK